MKPSASLKRRGRLRLQGRLRSARNTSHPSTWSSDALLPDICFPGSIHRSNVRRPKLTCLGPQHCVSSLTCRYIAGPRAHQELLGSGRQGDCRYQSASPEYGRLQRGAAPYRAAAGNAGVPGVQLGRFKLFCWHDRILMNIARASRLVRPEWYR